MATACPMCNARLPAQAIKCPSCGATVFGVHAAPPKGSVLLRLTVIALIAAAVAALVMCTRGAFGRI